jgi:hypothetical protein
MKHGSRQGRLAGIVRGLGGRGVPIALLAAVGILGTASGLALASDNSPGGAVGSIPEGCTRVDGPGNDDEGVDMGTTVINGITLQFTQTGQGTMHWEVVDPPGAIFVGTITMKGGPDLDGIDWTYTAADNASSGDIHTPVNPNNGHFYGISHAQSCGGGDTSSTTSTGSTDSTTTITEPDTTSTVTENTTSTITEPVTETTTLPDTTTTVTDPDVTTTVTEPDTTSTVTQDVTTTTTGPDTTLTTTIPCVETASRVVSPKTLTTVTVPGSTVTQTVPGTTDYSTVPGDTSTITEDGTTSTVTEPGSTITETQPGSTLTTTVPGSTFVSTIPGTTNTVTDCTNETTSTTTSTGDSTSTSTDTGAVLGTSTSGGDPGGKGKPAAKKSNDSGGGNGAIAADTQDAAGSLPFTGFQAPVLILLGLGMAAAGVLLRRRLGSAD